MITYSTINAGIMRVMKELQRSSKIMSCIDALRFLIIEGLDSRSLFIISRNLHLLKVLVLYQSRLRQRISDRRLSAIRNSWLRRQLRHCEVGLMR